MMLILGEYIEAQSVATILLRPCVTVHLMPRLWRTGYPPMRSWLPQRLKLKRIPLSGSPRGPCARRILRLLLVLLH